MKQKINRDWNNNSKDPVEQYFYYLLIFINLIL